MTPIAIGVDVGGTFTDLVAVSDDGTVRATKVLTTRADQSEGVTRALDAARLGDATVSRIVHGTTIATNTLLERTGARVVLCATAGATDLLELRRQDRAALYDLARHHPAPLAAPEDVVPVPERVAPEGVLRALGAPDAERVAAAAAARRPDAVAVTLLHAYADATHEQTLAAALRRRLPETEIVLSSEVLPEIREYERASTTVAEAYLRPAVGRYLRRLADRMRERGMPVPQVMTSGGGVRDAEEAARHAASLALSGPAGGVVGAALVAAAAGIRDALTIDIGGTSADVGLILDGSPLVESGGEVAGATVALPRVLVETLSAGGGSLAWQDDGGALRVGPRSAGAEPGPAAFDRGGVEPTVTDAHVVLGTIHARRLSGGVAVDRELARQAVQRLADRLGAKAERVAAAVVAVADAAMARALRRVSVDRGVDPRRCALIAFGGGGPLHACGLAEGLGMTRVLVPPHAGVLSALGLAATPERRESLASVMQRADALDDRSLGALLERLVHAVAWPATRTLAAREWWLRCRYMGQGHELEVPVTPGEAPDVISSRFAELHERRFAFTLERPVEVVSARHAASGLPHPVHLARRGAAHWDRAAMEDDGGALDVALRGPASVALPDATLYVAAGWTAHALPIGGWMVERDS